MRTIRIGLFVFDDCQEGGLTAPLDVFRTANTIAARRAGATDVVFEPKFVAARRQILKTAHGFKIAVQAARPGEVDALIVPGLIHTDGAGIRDAIDSLSAETRLIGKFLSAGKPVLSACSGVFLIAASGAINSRRATTSWWLGAEFERLFPAVRLDTDSVIVCDGACVSAGGVASYYDLALWLVGHFAGNALRKSCAKVLVVDMNRQSQIPFVAKTLIDEPRDVLFSRARSWLNQRLETAVLIDDLARHCRVSPRTLLRKFSDQLRQTPVQYVQTLRLERAKALLEGSGLAVSVIAERCGYQDVSSFRKTFKLRIRLTPNQYRNRFQTAKTPPSAPGRLAGVG